MRLENVMKKAAFSACAGALVLLSACGGGDYHPPSTDGGGTGNGGGTTPPPATMVDTFVAAVLNLIGMTSETAEPVSTDTLTATAPENTEPAAVSK